MDDAEEDSVAAVSAPLLIRHSLRKRKKIRPIRTCLTRYFSFRFSMKKLFMTSVIVTLILLVYLVSKSNWMFGYHSYHFSVPRLKSYAACVVQKSDLENLWLKDKGLFNNETELFDATTTTTTKSEIFEKDVASNNFQHRRIVLIVSKTSYSSAFKSVSEILVNTFLKFWRLRVTCSSSHRVLLKLIFWIVNLREFSS